MAFLPAVAAAVSLKNENGKFVYDRLKYTSKYIPMIDVLYFLEKLDKELSRFLKDKNLPTLFSTIEARKLTKENHKGHEYNYEMINRIVPDLSVILYEGNPVSEIAKLEFERNGDYLKNNFCRYTDMDMSLRKIGLNLQELNDIISKEDKFAEFYARFGFQAGPIPPEDYEAFPNEVLHILYCETILNNYGEDAVSFETFVECYRNALDELEKNMQIVQKGDGVDDKQRV